MKIELPHQYFTGWHYGEFYFEGQLAKTLVQFAIKKGWISFGKAGV